MNTVTVTGYAKVLITLLKEGVPDDRLSILPDSQSDGYYVKFDQTTISNKVNCYISNTGLAQYLTLFFETLSKDTMKPKNVQIDCPMFPSVMLHLETMPSYLPLLLAQLELLQADWPFETVAIADCHDE